MSASARVRVCLYSWSSSHMSDKFRREKMQYASGAMFACLLGGGAVVFVEFLYIRVSEMQ